MLSLRVQLVSTAATRAPSPCASARLSDLAVPPANHLEFHKEGGRYNGYHSIEVNDQYRVLFHWTDAGAMDIAIDDYHN